MENREKIMSIALEKFTFQGFDATGIQEIVDAADITKPTLYHYFKSKNGLLDAILEKYFEKFFEKLTHLSYNHNDLMKSLKEITKIFFDFSMENMVFYRMQLTMYFASPESYQYKKVSGYNERIFTLIEHFYKEVSNYHGNMKGREKRYAFTLIGTINNYITLYLNQRIELNQDTIHDVVQQYMYGVFS